MQVSESLTKKLISLRDTAYELADKASVNSMAHSKYLGMAEAYDDALYLLRTYTKVEPKIQFDPYNTAKYQEDEIRDRVSEDRDAEAD